MPGHISNERQPIVSLIYLLLLVLAGIIISSLIAVISGILIFLGPQGLMQLISGLDLENINFLKYVQIISAVGTFIIPALIFGRLENTDPLTYFGFRKQIKPLLFILAVAVMIASTPFLEGVILLNKEMHLPEAFQTVERWMKQKEDDLAKLTMQLLSMKTAAEFAINLFMIAIIPAIGEELFFRGCLQKVFIRIFKNYHTAIWITAIVFSAIHLQFYGFFPRMLLGALFGYLYVWTGNIGIPILAHFINNASAVISAYFYQQKGLSLDKINEETYNGNLLIYMASFVLTAVLLFLVYKIAQPKIKESPL
ncbi:lysostaphin resistance A-like protein [Rubrolithibacter danxiaensis]|uniref:CPBP family intramembrane glutamic endopeptidase n=1 Tax=Rubrolithibacter danxiaensis TaxID=3390805 RepID=UPI003BF814B2